MKVSSIFSGWETFYGIFNRPRFCRAGAVKISFLLFGMSGFVTTSVGDKLFFFREFKITVVSSGVPKNAILIMFFFIRWRHID